MKEGVFMLKGIFSCILSRLDGYTEKNVKSIYSFLPCCERVTASICIIILFASHYLNIIELKELKNNTLWNENFRMYLKNNTIWYWGVWILITAGFGTKIFCWMKETGDKTDTDLIPGWITIRSVYDLIASSILLMFSINILIEYSYGHDIWSSWKNYAVFGTEILYLFCFYINKAYVHFEDTWEEMKRRYTDYYDSEGTRIAEEDIVIYYGKRYRLYQTICHQDNYSSTKREWKLWDEQNTLQRESDSILLEEALQNKVGRLLVEKRF